MQKRLQTLLIILLTAISASLSAAPVGYSVNSDSGSDLSDGLYTIDLETGLAMERIGTVQSTLLQRRIDVEGLAFAPDGTLYGVDDESLKLFAIQLNNHALVDPNRDYDISELSSGNNDFGMTFACDQNLYITSVTDQSLYRLTLDGNIELVGGTEKGKLGKNISALAAVGFPVELYGLGNGTVSETAASTPTLYRIDTITGIATEVGPLNGEFGSYAESGLAFDEAGDLWAITDRRPLDQPSQIMKVDKSTGAATDIRIVQTLTDDEARGFESLAITGPGGCTSSGNGQIATFFVRKRFDDGNDITPVTLHFQCDGGTVFNGTKTLYPTDDDYGIYQTSFSVDNVPEAPISCQVWEETPPGYTPEYSCDSETSCTTDEGAGPCTFDGITAGQEDLCLIVDQVTPVEVTVTEQWDYTREDTAVNDNARIELICSGVEDGDGEWIGKRMVWNWQFEGNPVSQIANLSPDFGEGTICWTEEHNQSSAVESESNCSEPIAINVGDENTECLVINSVFFEGIPTLNHYGIILFAAFMMLTGIVAIRRLG
jgi:hypothetical protein